MFRNNCIVRVWCKCASVSWKQCHNATSLNAFKSRLHFLHANCNFIFSFGFGIKWELEISFPFLTVASYNLPEKCLLSMMPLQPLVAVISLQRPESRCPLCSLYNSVKHKQRLYRFPLIVSFMSFILSWPKLPGCF